MLGVAKRIHFRIFLFLACWKEREVNVSRIVALGCGSVGRHMAIDLCRAPGCEVISVDVNREGLERLAREHPIQARVEDLSTVEGITRAVEDADIVIGRP
jgi:saccharopine dehydrogenase-like NADP-dependent oxidoreductase